MRFPPPLPGFTLIIQVRGAEKFVEVGSFRPSASYSKAHAQTGLAIQTPGN